MSDAVPHQIVDTAPDLSPDFGTQLDALRAAGGSQFDPVRLHYLEALATRTMAHQGKVKAMLEAKLTLAIAAFKERLTQAQADAKASIAQVTPHHPAAINQLELCLGAGNLKELRQSIASLPSIQAQPSLAGLVQQLEQQTPETSKASFEVNASSRPELKTLRNFRTTWSTLSADKQVSQALAQAPKNAGPINSHMLVVRSLALMRDISPDYLNRFLSYTDTLLCLDQCENEKSFNVKKPATGKTAKK